MVTVSVLPTSRVLFLLVAFLASHNAWATEPCTMLNDGGYAPLSTALPISSTSNSLHIQHISGVVNAAQPQRHLANVTIRLLGTPYCTLSNEKGEFVLDVDASLYPQAATLVATRNNYESKTFVIGNMAQVKEPMVLQLIRSQPYSNEEILHLYYTGRVKPESTPVAQGRIAQGRIEHAMHPAP